jgi:hypothetical protein
MNLQEVVQVKPGEIRVTTVLGDAVDQAAPGAKVSMLGIGWNTISVARFPTIHTCAVAILVRIPWTATNQLLHLSVDDDGHSVSLQNHAIDGEMQEAMKIEAQVNVGRPPFLDPGDEQVAVLAVPLSLSLRRPGRYSLIVRIEDQEIDRISFKAVPQSPMPTA